MTLTIRATSLALAALVATSPVGRADDVDVAETAAALREPGDPSAALAPIAKGTRTVYIFNGARHFDLTTAIGALTATHCTHLGAFAAGTTSVPILVEFYDSTGTLRGSATSNLITQANASTTICTGINATSRKVGCNPGMGLTSTVSLSGFVRVVAPTKNANKILCTAEVASGVDGGAANIVDRLIGVRKGALVLPPDTFIP